MTIIRSLGILFLCTLGLAAQDVNVPSTLSDSDLDAKVEKELAFIPAIVAIYSNGQISGSEIRQLMRPQLRARMRDGIPITPAQMAVWAHKLIEGELDQQLFLRQAFAAGYTVNSQVAFEQLRLQEEKLGAKAFKRLMDMQGVPRETVARKIAENDAVNRWMNERVIPAFEISEEEARQYYKEHKDEFDLPESREVWHILIASVDEWPKARRKAALESAEFTLKLIQDGGDFERIAKSSSDGPAARNGGYLGLAPLNKLAKPIRNALKKMKQGEVSGIIKSDRGYHIVKAGASAEKREVDFETVRDRIFQRLQGEAVSAAIQRIRQQIRHDANAKILLQLPGQKKKK